MSRHLDIEQRAAEWLMRRGEPDWSEEQSLALEQWLAEAPAHKVAFWRLEHGWKQAERIRSLGDNVVLFTARERLATLVLRTWRPAALAASLALGLYGLNWGINKPQPVEIAQNVLETSTGGLRRVGLDDGSRIELNTQTRIRTAVSTTHREVWLDHGEVFFSVAHAVEHPFVVHAGPKKITVLGTKFSVRREGDKVTVSVLEGRVRVDEGSGVIPGSSSTITGGDIAISEGKSLLVATKEPEAVVGALAWRDGMLTFDQSSLGEVAAEFNRYNDKKIVIVDPSVSKIRIGGTFQSRNIDAFARLLQEAYGLKANTTEKEIRISE